LIWWKNAKYVEEPSPHLVVRQMSSKRGFEVNGFGWFVKENVSANRVGAV